MNSAPFNQVFRSRWLLISVHLGLWLLLYLAATSFGGKAPPFTQSDAMTPPSDNPLPVERMEFLFAANSWPKSFGGTNTLNPFFTRHFQPSPPPPNAPAPTTKKITLTYQGFYQTGTNTKTAMVKMGNDFLVAAVGAKLTANLYAANAAMMSLTLTNPAAQTNILKLNTAQEVEVPVK